MKLWLTGICGVLSSMLHMNIAQWWVMAMTAVVNLTIVYCRVVVPVIMQTHHNHHHSRGKKNKHANKYSDTSHSSEDDSDVS